MHPDQRPTTKDQRPNTRVKLLQIITLGEQGGAQKHLISLINGLSTYDIRHTTARLSSPKSYDITVVCGGKGELLSILPENVHKIHIPELKREISPINDWQTLLKLVRLIKKERFDIVHTHSSKAGILGRLAAKLASYSYNNPNKPPSGSPLATRHLPLILFTAHGLVYQEPLHPLIRLGYFIAEKISALWTTRIITVSNNDALIATALLPKERIVTIHNGLDPAPYIKETRDDNFIRSLGLDPARPIIGTVANFYKTKGHVYFLNGIAQLMNDKRQMTNDKRPQFVLIGQGPLAKDLQEECVRLDITDQVHFLGQRSDIPRLLKQMDVFVLSSLKEGFPYVILEAMASGLPIVSTNVGGIPEVVDTKGALLVPPGNSDALANAIRSILDDPTKRSYAQNEFPKIIKDRFSETAMVEQVTALYSQLLNTVSLSSLTTHH